MIDLEFKEQIAKAVREALRAAVSPPEGSYNPSRGHGHVTDESMTKFKFKVVVSVLEGVEHLLEGEVDEFYKHCQLKHLIEDEKEEEPKADITG